MTAPLLALVGCCAGASITDIRFRKIPNWLCAVTALTGLAFAIVAAAAPWWSYALHGGIGFVAATVLFALRWIGGGNGKFYAALACWFPLADAPILLAAVSTCTVALIGVSLAFRRIRLSDEGAGKALPISGLPYGAAISLGAVLAYLTFN